MPVNAKMVARSFRYMRRKPTIMAYRAPTGEIEKPGSNPFTVYLQRQLRRKTCAPQTTSSLIALPRRRAPTISTGLEASMRRWRTLTSARWVMKRMRKGMIGIMRMARMMMSTRWRRTPFLLLEIFV